MGRSLMIIVVGFTTIFTGVMFNLTSSQQSSSKEIVRQYDRWLRNNAIESITNVALSKVYRDSVPDDTLELNGVQGIIRTFDATADSVNQVVSLGIEVATSYAGGADSTYAAVMWPAYSFYYFFMHDWPSHRTYASGDTLWGPVHANSKIKVTGTPIFMGRVSSDDNIGFNGDGNPKLYGGAELDTQTIQVPNDAMLNPLRTVTAASGDWFNQSIWLVFNDDSTYTWSADSLTWAIATKLNANNGTIGTTDGNDIKVRGIVAGRMTVTSGRDIIIQDTLRYKTNPSINGTSQDYLGIIARNRVIFQYTTNTGMVVQAAVMAASSGIGSVLIENKVAANADLALTLLGSIVAVEDSLATSRIPATSLPVNNFNFTHLYDTRLRLNTPPYYPRTNRVEPFMRGFITAMD